MILNGAKLEEMGRAIWGSDWARTLSQRLKVTRQAIYRRAERQSGFPKELKRQLLAAAEEQLVIVARYVDRLREDCDH